MALVNFNASVCNYTTEVVQLTAVSGFPATNTYEYVDLDMIPKDGYYLDIADFSYVSNDYVDYVVFLQDETKLKARAYLKGFTWPTGRTDLEVPIDGCARLIVEAPVTATTTTTTTAAVISTTAYPCPGITGYFITQSSVPERGETRTLKVYGQDGAEFNYSVTNSSNSSVLASGTKTLTKNGFVDIDLVFPLVSTPITYNAAITTPDACTLQLQSQASTFDIYQGENQEWRGDSYECVQGTTTTTTTTTTTAPTTTTTTSAPTTTTTTTTTAGAVDFVVSFVDSITNATFSTTSETISALAGATNLSVGTKTITPDTNYNNASYTVAVSGSNSSSISAPSTVTNSLSGITITEMPNGGGSATITVSGAATYVPPQYTFTLNFVDSITNASFSVTQYQVTTAEGVTTNLSNRTITPASGYTNMSATYSVSKSGTGSGSVSIPSTVSNALNNVSITMPNGGGSATITVSGSANLLIYGQGGFQSNTGFYFANSSYSTVCTDSASDYFWLDTNGLSLSTTKVYSSNSGTLSQAVNISDGNSKLQWNGSSVVQWETC